MIDKIILEFSQLLIILFKGLSPFIDLSSIERLAIGILANPNYPQLCQPFSYLEIL